MPLTPRTVQLRRYVLAEGHFDAYIEWWNHSIAGLRARYGFTIDAAYADPENRQFVWALSVPGDEAEFARVESIYMESPERAAAFADTPEWVTSSLVSFVSPQADRAGITS